MKKLTKEQRKMLDFAWRMRLTLHAEGDKLRAEGAKLYVEGDKLRAEGDKLRAEGDKLHVEGNKLYAEGSKLHAESVIAFVGNIKLEWIWRKSNYDCKLETGDVFRHDALRVEQ